MEPYINGKSNKINKLRIDLIKEILTYCNFLDKFEFLRINKKFKNLITKNPIIQIIKKENLMKKIYLYFRPGLEKFIKNKLEKIPSFYSLFYAKFDPNLFDFEKLEFSLGDDIYYDWS